MAGITIEEVAAEAGGRLDGALGVGTPAIDLTHDSRSVEPGWGFACVRGAEHDAHRFASAAVAAGAGWLLVDHPVEDAVPQIVVPDVRAALAPVAAAVHGHPSRHLSVVGVTGTAGKTTVTHAIADVLEGCGHRCSVLGTLDGARTTPEATDLQRWLAGRLAGGDDHVAIEVSSHALDLGRVDAVSFAAGVFTNLGPEHLDFHGTMDAYYEAKARLFDGRSRVAVVNIDDEWGRRLAAAVAPGPVVHTYGEHDVTAVELTSLGSSFAWRGHRTTSRLVGRFNLVNLAAAATVVAALGADEAEVAASIAAVRPVRGRMESVPVPGADIAVIVDYSHKPDALRAALTGVRELTEGRLWVVFGAGGDRDTAKRPLMGAVAVDLADRVVVTSDNPRSEDPRAIIDDILAGVGSGADRVEVEPDRSRAIALAVDGAAAGDVVVVAGKGHEVTQTIGSQVLDFDDREVARHHLGIRVQGGTAA